MEVAAGTHLYDAIGEAVAEALATLEVVRFEFNGTTHDARPSDSFETARQRAEEAVGHPILSPEESAKRAAEETKRMEREWAEAIESAGVPNEQQMRDADVPTPHTVVELAEYIRSLTERPHDYGTCVYAMSMAAVAAFNHVASVLGVTGFQAGCADLDILRRIRRLEHGFRLIDYGKLLYPQHWDEVRTPIFLDVLANDEARQRFAEAAAKLLAEGGGTGAVRDHWRWLVDKAAADGVADWRRAAEATGRRHAEGAGHDKAARTRRKG